MAKIKSPEEAIAVIIEMSVVQAKCSMNGEARKANKAFDKREKALEYLKQNKKLYDLVPLLNSKIDAVRLYVALKLLFTDYEKRAERILEELERIKRPFVSSLAKYNLMWYREKKAEKEKREDNISVYTKPSPAFSPHIPSPPQTVVPIGTRADGLIGPADMFSYPDVSVFKVMNFFGTPNPTKYLLSPTAFELIPDEDDDSARFYFIKALQVFADKTVPCYMSMDTDERLTEYVVKKNETGIVLEEMDGQEHSIIPAIASDRYGRNSELYYAEENPRIGFEILKAGLKKARNREIVEDDIAMLKNEIDYRRREK